MNTAGWLLTENGRQPWIVQGLHADQGRRLAVGRAPTEVVISLVVLLRRLHRPRRVDVFLMLRYARRGLELEQPDEPTRRRRRAARPAP